MAGGSNRGKHHARTIDKIKLLIRLELGSPHLTLGQICQIVGIPQTRVAVLRRLPLYTQLHTQFFSGIITRLDDKVDQNYELSKATMQFAVPMAMQTLVQQALNAKDERVKNKACNDILDRDGHFPKVSRGIIVQEDVKAASSEKDNKDIATLQDALAIAKAKIPAPVSSSIDDDPITTTTQ